MRSGALLTSLFGGLLECGPICEVGGSCRNAIRHQLERLTRAPVRSLLAGAEPVGPVPRCQFIEADRKWRPGHLTDLIDPPRKLHTVYKALLLGQSAFHRVSILDHHPMPHGASRAVRATKTGTNPLAWISLVTRHL
jgi:hypothetical protein